MKRTTILLIAVIFGLNLSFAQDEEAPKKKKERPVKDMFASDLAIDDQTSVIPDKKTLEMQIQHRFGLIKDNGINNSLYSVTELIFIKEYPAFSKVLIENLTLYLKNEITLKFFLENTEQKLKIVA